MIGNYKVISVCISRVHDTSSYDFVKNLNKQLADKGYRLFIYNLCNEFVWGEKKNVEAAVYDLIDYDTTDAVIIMDEKIRNKEITDEIVAKAKEKNVPVVVVDGEYEGCTNMKFDYRHGFELVVRHVMEHHNITDVHFMGGVEGNPFADERLDVFKEVLKEKGIEFKDSMVSNGRFYSEATAEATEEIIASGHIPQAIICANDIMAISVANVLIKNGIKVPEQCIVTGFDGINEIKYLTPRISSCFCNYAEMANQVGSVVDAIFEGKKFEETVYVSPELIPAESCGCSSNEDASDSLRAINTRFNNAMDENRKMFAIVESMQNSPNLNSAVECLDYEEFRDLKVIINKSCLDSSRLLITLNIEGSYEDDMCVFYDAKGENPFIPYDFHKSDIIPNLAKCLETGYPLIFNELDFMGVTLGYVVFCFDNYSIVNYSRISLVVTALRNAVGGFSNVQYQHYITKKMGELYKFDPQTELFNRFGFELEYRILHDRLKKEGGKITALFVDLKDLQSINEEYGYAAGDDAIEAVSEGLKQAVPENTLCAHFGGSDMIAVIEGDADTDTLISKVKEFMDSYNEEADNPFKVEISAGVYKVDASGDIESDTIVRESRKASR